MLKDTTRFDPSGAGTPDLWIRSPRHSPFRPPRTPKKEMWHENFPQVKYEPSSDKRSGNQKVMIKVCHTNCQLFACANRAQSDFMVGIYCKKYQWAMNSCIQDGGCRPQQLLDTCHLDWLKTKHTKCVIPPNFYGFRFSLNIPKMGYSVPEEFLKPILHSWVESRDFSFPYTEYKSKKQIQPVKQPSTVSSVVEYTKLKIIIWKAAQGVPK